MDSSKELAVIIAGIIGILGALGSVINSLKENKKRGIKQDRRIKQIHILVNSRLTVALKLVAMFTKREAERTKNPDDMAAYEEAAKELRRAMTVAVTVEEDEAGEPDAE